MKIKLLPGEPRFLAVVFCITLIFLIGCERQKDLAETKKGQKEIQQTVTVGAVLPLTGAGAAAGGFVRDSLLLAAEQYQAVFKENAASLQVEIADSKSSPRDGITAYRELVAMHPDIRIVFVQMSSVANALAPMAKDDEVVLVSIGASEEPLRAHPYFLINYLDATTQAKMYLEHAKSQPSLTVYYLNDEYGRSVNTAIEQAAADSNVISHPFSLDGSTRDIVASTLPKTGSVVIVGYGLKMAEIARELEVMGFRGDIQCSAELLVASNLQIAKTLTNPIWAVIIEPLPSEISDMYPVKLNRESNAADVLAYNGMLIVSDALIRSIRDGRQKPTAKIVFEYMEQAAHDGAAPSVINLKDQRLIYKAAIRQVNR